MTTERSVEYAGVVSPNPANVKTVDASTSDAARTTAHQTETFTSDPYAGRRESSLRVQTDIYLLFGILEGLLGIRFVLPLLGANPAAGFAQFIYSITKPFLAPFVGLFGTARFGGGEFDVSPLLTILVYALITWILVKVVALVTGDSPRGLRTTSSQIYTKMK